MGNATVNYSFKNYGLSVSIVISTELQTFQAADNKSYQGYAIQSGSGVYTPSGGSQLTFNIAPQSVNQYNVLWASTDDGCGGSSHGIDTNGVSILGDNGTIAWNGSEEGVASFSLQEGAVSGPVTLSKVKNWPPKS